MKALETLNLPAMDALLARAADLLNGFYLPEATVGSVAAGIAALPVLLALAWLVRRLTARPAAGADLAKRLDEISQRLHTTELLLADSSGETSQLRQRVEELTSRQENITASNNRNGLRQAIALSKHGATTRQLIDTCGLSQGEAHLIQNLYGRPTVPAQAQTQAQPEELH